MLEPSVKLYDADQFSEWEVDARNLGWVHCHDNVVVVDCDETGVCLGEFEEGEGGWLSQEEVENVSEK